ncbi:hypothetical protein ACFV9E_03605 [Streptomyces sp. NPDC059835]|uniref:hypothetical protein n=1 Tax=Streptomyces sp. NPDC059835 TaxID=3346967 RepID=UPI003648A198
MAGPRTRLHGKLDRYAETVAASVGRWHYKADGWADIETAYRQIEPADGPTAPVYALVRVFAECTARYTLNAPDLSPSHTELTAPLRPESAIVTYTSHDGRVWQIDAVDIIGRLVQADERVSDLPRRQRYHVELAPLTVATEFRTGAPQWLHEFASAVRVPSPSEGQDRNTA